ncbi:MAG: Nif3-like dinuclear metal center hexameric protein [Porphyromonadaceae bacterium]|nr:Nif3-like dinuclear metal center hexameric protein [Porphyromonadaceae bacterium]
MTVSEVTSIIEEVAPLALQENYDNAGLLIGEKSMKVSGVLISIDVTESVIDEAIQNNCNLIISHHPLIFRGLKRITGTDYIQRCVIKSIKNDIAIYAAHTNIDNVKNGVNGKIADKIGLINRQILQPKSDFLLKLVTFVPHEHVEKVQKALFSAGAGQIGDYDSCSFNLDGTGTFRAGDNANPFVGNKNELHLEPETRIEVILPKHLKNKVVASLIHNHPYEEPAFDIFPLMNTWDTVGIGMVGELEKEMDEIQFLDHLKKVFSLKTVRHTPLSGRKIKKVSLCGGSGSEFLRLGIAHKADVYVSGDFKYHEFFDAECQILIADIGHYESEQFTKDVFYEIITKKIPNFAVRISDVNTNPINYY